MRKTFKMKGLAIAAGMVFAVIGSMALDANAQSRRQIERERERIERQRERLERQRDRQIRNRGDRNDSWNRGSNRAGSNNAVIMGYQQGLLAGQSDRRAGKYGRFNVYRNTGSRPNMGDPTSYDYLYRQGYLEGYDDGYYGRRRY